MKPLRHAPQLISHILTVSRLGSIENKGCSIMSLALNIFCHCWMHCGKLRLAKRTEQKRYRSLFPCHVPLQISTNLRLIVSMGIQALLVNAIIGQHTKHCSLDPGRWICFAQPSSIGPWICHDSHKAEITALHGEWLHHWYPQITVKASRNTDVQGGRKATWTSLASVPSLQQERTSASKWLLLRLRLFRANWNLCMSW